MTPAELAELRRRAAPRTEARVIRAVITEPAKLALADATEVGDFAHPGNANAFGHVRHLQETGAEVDILAVCDADEMRRLAHGTAGANAMAIHLRDYVFAIARPYELTFGFDAAVAVFEADLHQLRLIADARRAA